MKAYKFFYFDSYEGSKSIDVKEYVVYSPRFDSAFNCFTRFLSSHPSSYIDFMQRYGVFNNFKTQLRSLSDSDVIYLTVLKDNHNAKFWETFDGN